MFFSSLFELEYNQESDLGLSSNLAKSTFLLRFLVRGVFVSPLYVTLWVLNLVLDPQIAH